MNHLPTELLVEIFALSCDIGSPPGFTKIKPAVAYNAVEEPHPTSCSTNLVLSLHQCPILAISQVCRDWRDVSLASPQLWSRIEIREELKSATGRRVDVLERLLELLLPRSGKLPLDIVLEFTEFSNDNHEFQSPSMEIQSARLFYPLFPLLCNETYRWRTVHFCMHRHITVSFGTNTLWPRELEVPKLEYLHIHSLGDWDHAGWTSRSFGIDISSAPLLHTLIFTGYSFRGSSLIPLSSLRLLQFHGGERSLAGPSTHLIIREDAAYEHLHPQIDESPCLARVFDLRRSSFWLGQVFRAFEMPNLVELAVELEKGEIHSLNLHCEDLIALLRQSSAGSITHFMLARFFLTDAILLEIIKELPALTHLAIGERFSDNTFEEAVPSIDDDYPDIDESVEFPLTTSFFRGLPERLKEVHFAFHAGIGVEDIPSFLDILQVMSEYGHLQYAWLIVPKFTSDLDNAHIMERVNQSSLRCRLDWTDIDIERNKECCGIGKWIIT
ncbi:hypothetical protein VKT23_011555 [Stygiomarasmius scandens]|uniref:F-box domain-containing protein n=1 Tax=Marasmiellus scandens TaxID=2682957 RepID=A0ABR1J8L8_9AGAR